MPLIPIFQTLIRFITCTLFLCSVALANPMFGDYENQFSLNLGHSVRDFNKLEKLYYGDITYSQPTKFFRWHARRNIELGGFVGQDCNTDKCNSSNGYPSTDELSQYDLVLFGLSGDVILFVINGIYGNIRLGAYIRSRDTNRISSAFSFGERLGIGYTYDTFTYEIFYRHFSNGTLTSQNAGQDFYGITIGYNFN